jgi:hypothetical protein
MPIRLLLGPQRPVTNLGQVVADAGVPAGTVAVISAGWQEAEGDIDDVREQVPGSLIDLKLYHRAEEAFSTDEHLRNAHRERQDQLKELQRLYRLRLRQLMIAARQVHRSGGNAELVAGEERHAISQLRALDRHHLGRIESIHRAFDDRIGIGGSQALAEHVTAIRKILDDCSTVLITGGNVIVLLNRLRLFGVDRLLSEKHLIAWSAGAMVLSDLIVLYHDKTPQGRRDAEVFSTGAGVLPGYVFLPDAQRRLKDNDAVRISLLCRRFSPASSVTLDSGSMLQFEDTGFRKAVDVRRLTNKGRLVKVRTP